MFFNNKNKTDKKFGNNAPNYTVNSQNSNKKTVSKLFDSHKKTFFLILSILCLLAITRINYIGGSFLDSFVFGMFFGYFRFVFYIWVFVSFICLLFNLHHKVNIRWGTRWFFLFIILGCSWFQEVNVNSSFWKNGNNGFSETWKTFGKQLSKAFNNITTTGAFNGNYNSMPSGIVGIGIVSIFFAIPNAGAAQAIFWIVTLGVAITIIGYILFNDFMYIGNLIKYLAFRFYYLITDMSAWLMYRFRIFILKNRTNKKINIKDNEVKRMSYEEIDNHFEIKNEEDYVHDVTIEKPSVETPENKAKIKNEELKNKYNEKTNSSNKHTALNVENAYKELRKSKDKKYKNLYINLQDHQKKDNSIIGGISETIKSINVKSNKNNTNLDDNGWH